MKKSEMQTFILVELEQSFTHRLSSLAAFCIDVIVCLCEQKR